MGNAPFELPSFKGFTIDLRLKEFRKADVLNGGIEFIPFNSSKGFELLDEMREYYSFLY